MELENLLSKIENVKKDILDYIVSTEHYIFNWIDDKNVQDFIKEYPDEYEDMIYLHVIHASSSPTIRIYFENHPDDTKWVADVFIPTAVEYGCNTIYFIIDKNNSIKEELEGQESDSSDKIEFKYIYSMNEIR